MGAGGKEGGNHLLNVGTDSGRRLLRGNKGKSKPGKGRGRWKETNRGGAETIVS